MMIFTMALIIEVGLIAKNIARGTIVRVLVLISSITVDIVALRFVCHSEILQ